MNRMARLVAFGCLLLAGAWLAVSAFGPVLAQAKRSDAVVKVTASAGTPAADGQQLVVLDLAIEEGWHVYANPVGLQELESVQTVVIVNVPDVKVEYPAGKLVKDPVVGDHRVYEGRAQIKAVVRRPAGFRGPLEATVKFQACSDKTCLMPASVKLTVP